MSLFEKNDKKWFNKTCGDQKCYLWEICFGGVIPELWMTILPFSQYAHTCYHWDKEGLLEFSRATCIITSIIIW